MAMLDEAKRALRVTAAEYDDEIEALIEAARLDLGIAGVILPKETDALVTQAIKTYVRCHFGSPPDYDRLKAAYDEQKAQLQNATGYTDWRGADAKA